LTGPSGAVDAPTCTSDSGSTYPISLTCTAIANLSEPGQYCWDVTVTDESETYTPDQVVHLGLENQATECFEILLEEFEGLTPGFWKANAENWGAGAWVSEDPEDDFNAAFGTTVELRISKAKSDTDKGDSSNPTLYGALSATGGQENALARHCVAAKLNAENPDVEYPWDTATVIEECGNALNSSDKNVIENLKNQLDEWNNLGADIDQHWSP
jgi:hypothetical protein